MKSFNFSLFMKITISLGQIWIQCWVDEYCTFFYQIPFWDIYIVIYSFIWMVIRTQKYKKNTKEKNTMKKVSKYILYTFRLLKRVFTDNEFGFSGPVFYWQIRKRDPRWNFFIFNNFVFFLQLPKYIFKHIVPHWSLLAINFAQMHKNVHKF